MVYSICVLSPCILWMEPLMYRTFIHPHQMCLSAAIERLSILQFYSSILWKEKCAFFGLALIKVIGCTCMTYNVHVHMYDPFIVSFNVWYSCIMWPSYTCTCNWLSWKIFYIIMISILFSYLSIYRGTHSMKILKKKHQRMLLWWVGIQPNVLLVHMYTWQLVISQYLNYSYWLVIK